MTIDLQMEKEESACMLGEELKTEIVGHVKRIRSHSNLLTQTDGHNFTTEN